MKPLMRWQWDSTHGLGKCERKTKAGKPCANNAIVVKDGVKVCRVHKK